MFQIYDLYMKVTNIDVNHLNIEQKQIFNVVIASAFSVDRGKQTESRLFYVDSPGGSGKTYLFTKLYEYLPANNIKTITSAWTGVAATLLRGGKSLYSIFKLPVPLIRNKCLQCGASGCS